MDELRQNLTLIDRPRAQAPDEDTSAHSPLARRMTMLARTFPCLRNAPGIDPFAPAHLDRWTAGVASHGEAIIARFLLSVWTGRSSSEWVTEPFCLMEALKVWDEAHREAFLAWAENPWWP